MTDYWNEHMELTFWINEIQETDRVKASKLYRIRERMRFRHDEWRRNNW